MLVSDIILSNFPSAASSDKVSLALQLMEDYDVQHLPIINNEKFLGVVSKGDLLDADENVLIGMLENLFIHVSVLPNEHFLSALKLASYFDVSLVPVINEAKEIQGIISQKKLIQVVADFFSTEEPGGIIVLEMDKRHFSFGEISRLIETNDAYVTQLNTSADTITGMLYVTIKISKMEVSDIVATLQRYEYSVKYYFGEELYENELKENYELLMTYLKI